MVRVLAMDGGPAGSTCIRFRRAIEEAPPRGAWDPRRVG